MKAVAEHEENTFLRDLALLIGLPLVGVIALLAWQRPWNAGYEVTGDTDVFAVAAGTWDWTGAEGFCADNPHTISFSPDRSVMTIVPRKPWVDSSGVETAKAEYDIQGHDENHIRGLMRGETRLTDSGEPMVWDLVLTSGASYRWRGTEWVPGGYTDEVRRCEGIFRTVGTSFGPVTLGQPWGASDVPNVSPTDTVIGLPPESAPNGEMIRIHRTREGVVTRLHFDYPQHTDFAAMVASYSRRLGPPDEHDAPPDPEAAERATWQDDSTRFQLVRDPRRSAATVYSVLQDLVD